MRRPAIILMVVLWTANAQAESPCPEILGCCDMACYTSVLGQPEERISYPMMLQYAELQKKVGLKYMAGSPYEKTKIYTSDRWDNDTLPRQEQWTFRQPRVTPETGAPFRWKCEIAVVALDNGKAGGESYACPAAPDCLRSENFTGTSVMSALKRGAVGDACKLPL
jgi:hypothetical protein